MTSLERRRGRNKAFLTYLCPVLFMASAASLLLYFLSTVLGSISSSSFQVLLLLLLMGGCNFHIYNPCLDCDCPRFSISAVLLFVQLILGIKSSLQKDLNSSHFMIDPDQYIQQFLVAPFSKQNLNQSFFTIFLLPSFSCLGKYNGFLTVLPFSPPVLHTEVTAFLETVSHITSLPCSESSTDFPLQRMKPRVLATAARSYVIGSQILFHPNSVPLCNPAAGIMVQGDTKQTAMAGPLYLMCFLLDMCLLQRVAC